MGSRCFRAGGPSERTFGWLVLHRRLVRDCRGNATRHDTTQDGKPDRMDPFPEKQEAGFHGLPSQPVVHQGTFDPMGWQPRA